MIPFLKLPVSAIKLPLTSKDSEGVTVPIPTLPSDLTANLLLPPTFIRYEVSPILTEAVTDPVAILLKLALLNALAGMFVNPEPSPENDPENDPVATVVLEVLTIGPFTFKLPEILTEPDKIVGP